MMAMHKGTLSKYLTAPNSPIMIRTPIPGYSVFAVEPRSLSHDTVVIGSVRFVQVPGGIEFVKDFSSFLISSS